MRSFFVVAAMAFLTVGITTVSRAENPDPVLPGQPRIGLVGGLDFSKPSFSDPTFASQFGTRTGIVLGAAMDFPIQENFYFQPELAYTQQGLQVTSTSGGTTGTVTLQYDSIRVPLLAKFRSIVSPGTHLFALLGPAFGLAVKRNINASISGTSASADLDASSALNSFNVDIDAGVGAEFEVGPNAALAVSARYSFGLTNVLNTSGSLSSGSTVTTNDYMKTRDIQILANLFFAI